MNSVLQQAFDGELSPAEQYRPGTEARRAMCQAHCRRYEERMKQLEKLDSPLHEPLIKVLDEQLDHIPLETAELFIDRFRLGARMMAEVYQAPPGYGCK